MNKYIYKTPDGTRDLLFEECEIHNFIKHRLTELFSLRGYHEVITPALEHYDLFSMESAGFAQEEMYKLVEPGGRLLVLRPDITMPIARLAATRLKDAPLPLRLHYTQKVFRVSPGYRGRSNESTQSGIELIGASGLLSDLEVILTAALSLEDCGMTGYQIEIGHAGIFKALAAGLPVDEEAREQLRLSIETKNYAALEDILESLPESAAVTAMKRLPRLFGGREVLAEAAGLFPAEAAGELDYLRQLLDCLEPDLQEKINLDLGLVHRNNYYTGVVFRGYLPGSGDTVLSGGRYDNLLGEFGLGLPATGFAVDNDALAGLLLSSGSAPGGHPAELLIFAVPGFEMQALRILREKTGDGTACELLPYEGREKALADAAARGVGRILFVKEEPETLTLV